MAVYKYVLGFMNYCSHDPAACLTKINTANGNTQYIFAEEGFLSRKKKSYQFPIRSIKYCLDYFGITFEQVDRICLDYMIEKRFNRTSDNYRLLVGDYIRANLKISKETKISFCESHHLAHAYTAFLPSPFDEAAVVVIDGLGSEQQTHSIFKADKNKIQLITTQYGNGIGELYTLVTKALGFDAGEEGKTMGLAPYGTKYKDQDKLLPSFKHNKYKHYCDYSHVVNRNPSPALKVKLEQPIQKEDIYEPYFSRLAYNIQNECEESVGYLIKKARKLTGCNNVCFAGGVALNCVANEKVSENLNHNLFVQPASGDTGIPFGLALYGTHLELKNLSSINLDKKHFFDDKKKIFKPYIIDIQNRINSEIESFDNGYIKNIIKKYGRNYDVNLIAKLLSEEKVGCLYYQGIEIGPRALGHRSFIADARNQRMKGIMNKKVKHREAYRPFAPIIIEEEFNEYFTGNAKNLYKYMLGAVICTEKCLKEAPAIVHVDNTARVQTVEENNGLIHEILKAYKGLTSIPILINTSFNDNNEPIVFSYQDALLCFLRTNADFLIIEDKIIFRDEIINIEELKEELIKKQKNWIEFYSRCAINELTYISNPSRTITLSDFINFNGDLTNAFSKKLPLINLIKFLSKINNKKLFLDNYHFEIIKELSKIFPSSNFLNNINTVFVEDKITSLDLIEDNEFVLLYNLSIYLKENTKNFYKPNSKILDLKNLTPSNENDLKNITLSYEVDISKNIDDFFLNKN